MNLNDQNETQGTDAQREGQRLRVLISGVAPVIASLSDDLLKNQDAPLTTLGKLRQVLRGAEDAVRGLSYDEEAHAAQLAPFRAPANPAEAFPFEKLESLLNKVAELANQPRAESKVSQMRALTELLGHLEAFEEPTRLRIGGLVKSLLTQWEPEGTPVTSPTELEEDGSGLQTAVKALLEKCRAYKTLDPSSDDAKALALEVKELSAPFRGNLAFMELLELEVG